MHSALQRVTREPFGVTQHGQPVEQITLTNASGATVRMMTYGAIIRTLTTPDRNGQLDDIVLGYDTLAEYEHDSPYFGAIVGRFANRIAHGRFTLDGTTHQLATNNGPNHLHGGLRGLDKVVWNAAPFEARDHSGVVFTYMSPDGEEGYPGTVQLRVTYTFTDDHALRIDYTTTTDRATPLNLSHHSYFNLTGGTRDVLAHELSISANVYTPIDATLIPTGVIAPVAGTPFDFRLPVALGARIAEPHDQLQHAGGYDHNFVLASTPASQPRQVATVVEPISGRTMTLFTTEPGMQLYSGNFLDGSIRGKRGEPYGHRYGFCLETQHFPDSPNQPSFPNTILRPGERFTSTTIYQFGAE